MAGHRFGKAVTGVRSAVAAPARLRTRGETADAAASEAAASRHGGSSPPGCTRFSWRAAAILTLRAELASPSGQGIGPTHRHPRVRVLERAPTASLAYWLKHLRDMRETHGSGPRRGTNISPVAQRQSTRPITGRPRIVTVRENQQQETDMTMTIRKPGRLVAVSPSPTDPERSSLRRLGNGLLIRAPRGSTPPGSPSTTITTHD